MADRLELHWHSRSGPDDLAGFCEVYPVARAHLDCRSGLWLWSVSWLAGIDARVLPTTVEGPSLRRKRQLTVGLRCQGCRWMMEAGMDRETIQCEQVAEKLAAALDRQTQLVQLAVGKQAVGKGVLPGDRRSRRGAEATSGIAWNGRQLAPPVQLDLT